MPNTVEAVILPGWWEREQAISYLRSDCFFDPPWTDEQAGLAWAQYRGRVESLPERAFHQPERFPIPANQRQLVDEFLQRLRGPEVLDVLKVNPMELVAYQFYVVTDRANHHHQQPLDWARKFLVIDRPTSQLPIRVEEGTIKVNLPHAEHMIGLQPDGAFRIQQGGGFVSSVEIEGRLILKAGYHRSFAFSRAVMNEPEARDRSVLVALTRTVPPQLAPDFSHQGLRTTVLGSRPPLFSDFFNCDLAMTVRLLKKRWEMHLKIVPVDD